MTTPALATHDLTKVYEGHLVVDGLDWTVESGTACALLGPNGSGKTTTLRMLMGFTPPSRGSCELLGVDAWNPPPAMRARVAYVPDQPALPGWMRVGELIHFHASFYPRWDAKRERELIDLFALSTAPRVSVLSKGQHRKLMLLLALCQNSDLLLLDEPASGLDVDSRRDFLGLLGEYLGQGERSLVFSTHLLTDVERIATHVLLLEHGRAIEQCALDALQEDVRSVTLSKELFERTREVWEDAGILERSDANGSATLLVRRFTSGPAELARTLPPNSLECSALPLEDVYLALTRAARKERQ
ncbi:MAG: ABC transporter ATP-binding protein [Planctomycetota bacterium]